MILYHGSTIAVEKPEIITSVIGRDFGFAFYTTDIKDQAIRWAKRKAMIASRKKGKWLDMVIQCRCNPNYQHEYDIVIGKIANDNVGETVSYVLQGIMRKEDAINRLKFEKINNQIAFCTERALNCLHFQKSFNGWRYAWSII